MTNNDSKSEFLQLCIESDILRFGEFTLKSGRTSPYFFNAGLFNTGGLLAKLGKFYASLIAAEIQPDFMMYGPAYKGIPLVAAIAVQLAQFENRNIAYAFNRKETKDHGEGGIIVGADLVGDVVVVDDVITAGTSINESANIINDSGATLSAIVIALDRQEKAVGEDLSAVQIVKKKYNVPVHSLIKLDDLIEFIKSSEKFNQHVDVVVDYRDTYGCN